jgi:hypothetical protein
MAWMRSKDEKVEFELPDEVKTQLKAGEDAKTKAAELETQLTANSQKQTALETELAQLKAALTAKADKEKPKEEEKPNEPDWFAAPKEAVQLEVAKNMQPLAVAVQEMRADRVLTKLKDLYPEMSYPKVAQELQVVTEKFNLDHRANEQLMMNTFRVVRDRLRESGELDKPEFSSFMERSRQNGRSFGDNDRSDPKKQLVNFTAEEQAFLDRYEIKPEEATEVLRSDKYKTIAGVSR